MKRAVLIAELNQIHGGAGVQARDVAEKIRAGGVEFHAHVIHARDDCIIERTLKGALIDIVLVLSNADGFRIDFDQLGKRVHEAATDGNGTAHSEVKIRKFLACDLGGRVNRSAGLAHHDNNEGCRQAKGANECLCLSRSRTIANGNRLDLEAIHDGLDHLCRLGAVASAFFGVNDLVSEELALSVEHGEFATRAKTRIDCEDNLLAKWRGQQELAKVFRKDPYRFLVGLFFVEKAGLTLHGKAKKTLEAILSSQTHLSG